MDPEASLYVHVSVLILDFPFCVLNALTLIRMAFKKVRSRAAGSHIPDSQATNRKQGGLPVRAPPPTALLLAI
jgi:hypothetical protein